VCVSLHVEFSTPGAQKKSPGSGRVGKLILQAAAPNLTPATWRPGWRDFKLAKAIEKCCVNIEKCHRLLVLVMFHVFA